MNAKPKVPWYKSEELWLGVLLVGTLVVFLAYMYYFNHPPLDHNDRR